jgi:hypothetical protein
MPILLKCPCGKTLRVGDEAAGKRVKCPACTAILAVPAPTPEPEVFELPPEELEAPPPKPYGRRKLVDDDEDEGNVGTYGFAGSGKGGTGGTGDAGDGKPGSKPMPDFRLGSGRREAKKHPGRKKN